MSAPDPAPKPALCPAPNAAPHPDSSPASACATAAQAQTAWTAAPARPRLSPRQSAMLAEMGVRPWWLPASLGAAASSSSPPRPAQRVVDASARSNPSAAAAGQAAQLQTAAAAPPGGRGSQVAPTPSPAPTAPAPHTRPAPPASDWDALEQQIQACQRCPLGAQRQCAVPGMGDRRPDWLLVGEAPGEEEDRQGLPFVGRAGQLLDRMLAALQLQREQRVYIANVIKCRPPQNRNPAADEIAHCTPYLLRQVELLQPKIVLALGRFAAQTLLAEGGCLSAEALRELPLGKLRGRVYQARLAGRVLPVVVTYHPAYLLRSPADKARAWADLCLAAEALEQSPSPAGSGLE